MKAHSERGGNPWEGGIIKGWLRGTPTPPAPLGSALPPDRLLHCRPELLTPWRGRLWLESPLLARELAGPLEGGWGWPETGRGRLMPAVTCGGNNSLFQEGQTSTITYQSDSSAKSRTQSKVVYQISNLNVVKGPCQ